MNKCKKLRITPNYKHLKSKDKKKRTIRWHKPLLFVLVHSSTFEVVYNVHKPSHQE